MCNSHDSFRIGARLESKSVGEIEKKSFLIHLQVRAFLIFFFVVSFCCCHSWYRRGGNGTHPEGNLYRMMFVFRSLRPCLNGHILFLHCRTTFWIFFDLFCWLPIAAPFVHYIFFLLLLLFFVSFFNVFFSSSGSLNQSPNGHQEIIKRWTDSAWMRKRVIEGGFEGEQYRLMLFLFVRIPVWY